MYDGLPIELELRHGNPQANTSHLPSEVDTGRILINHLVQPATHFEYSCGL
jgi:hypothetical protein